MTWILDDCTFVGPAVPEPFAKFELEALLEKKALLPDDKGDAGKELRRFWDFYRKKLRNLGDRGGAIRVLHHVLEPLTEPLGFERIMRQEQVTTREGDEEGGWLLQSADGTSHLRAWAVEAGIDLDAPSKRGHAYRFSPSRIAQRVLLAKNERLGLLTDGEELRLLFCDPARPDSHIGIRLHRSGGWRGAPSIPDSFRLVLAMASRKGIAHVPDLTDQARLTQTRVTAKLREQAKRAVLDFVQELLDHPQNSQTLGAYGDRSLLARTLWREGLVVIYRLLFVLKLEASSDPARAFSFASTSLWRNTYSPNTTLACHAREVLDHGADTGSFLEQGLRTLFRLFSEGVSSSELKISPLGGMLFGDNATALLERLIWSERAVAKLLDRLLWTPASGKVERQRVHYGTLDVEDLGRVYEALLELEPGIATEPMCRLRRQKLEVVVPAEQGEPYRAAAEAGAGQRESHDDDDNDDGEEEGNEVPRKGKQTKVEWVEEIAPGSFYLRVGLGRKATGSYYTPHAFVRFLVQETLGPQVEEVSPLEDPRPATILDLNVLDPAMGSGHFLVEACRFLGDKLYEACRACDELGLFDRVAELPDPNDELIAYLPSRTTEGEASGLAQRKALAISRRLVAVHCLYGVDKNPLAVELAKLSLWLESYAEGLPLTFLDHRLVCGDSLTGPFFDKLLTAPGSGKAVEGLFAQNLAERLSQTLSAALADVRELEKTVGKDVAEVEAKRAAKARLDADLAPFVMLARVWSGGVMLGEQSDDSAYEALIKAVAAQEPTEPLFATYPRLREMLDAGAAAVPYDLIFPEVFYPDGTLGRRAGFHVVLGNPPWEGIQPDRRQFIAEWIPDALIALPGNIASMHEQLLESDERAAVKWIDFIQQLEFNKRALLRLGRYLPQDGLRGGGAVVDYFLCFVDRCWACSAIHDGVWGLVLPNGFHTNLSGSILREWLIKSRSLILLIGFSNARRLFDISPGMRFDLVIAGGNASEGRILFGLEDPSLLLSSPGTFPLSRLSLSAPSFVIPEIASDMDLMLWQIAMKAPQTFDDWIETHESSIGEELHASKSSFLFHQTMDITDSDPRLESFQGIWPVHEKGTFESYYDLCREIPRYSVLSDELIKAGRQLEPARFYRLAHRTAIHAQEQMKSVFAILPPAVQVAHSASVEKKPGCYPTSDALHILAISNSFTLNAFARARVGLNLSAYLRAELPLPGALGTSSRYLAHAALRLTCNHAGYAALWKEQLGKEWREPGKKPYTWPVLEGDDARWGVRAAIDAVVADAYGLSREQYEHVLGSFSHRSYPRAPERCLAAFDELKQLGLEAFCKKHDPYWDIPLVTTLPEPVIELSVPAQADRGVPAKAGGRRKGKQKAAATGQLTLLPGGRK